MDNLSDIAKVYLSDIEVIAEGIGTLVNGVRDE